MPCGVENGMAWLFVGMWLGAMAMLFHHASKYCRSMKPGPVTLIQFLDHSENAFLEKHDDFSIAMMRARPRISALAIDGMFKEAEWRCVTRGEIVRAEIHAFLLGVKEWLVEWFREKRENFILDHGSFHAKNEIRKRRACRAMGIENEGDDKTVVS